MDEKEILGAILSGKMSAREALGTGAARTLAKTAYAYSQQLFEFAKGRLVQFLTSSPSQNENEGVFVGIFLRMYLWMESLVALNKNTHIQGVAVSLRALFELFLDLKILDEDKTGECYKKYIAFSEIEMFREGSKRVQFFEQNFPKNTEKYFIQKQFITNSERINRITSNLKQFWAIDDIKGIGSLKHWTKKHARDRAAQVGIEYEEIYIEFYQRLSQIVHGSGLEFFRKLDKEQFEAYYAYCHQTAQRVFIEAMKIVAKKMKLDKAWEHEDFFKRLDELKNENMGTFLINIIEELESKKNKSEPVGKKP